MALAAQQWQVLRDRLPEHQISIIQGRLAADHSVSPLAASQVRDSFERLALTPFWLGVVPAPVRAFVEANWRRSRDLIVLSQLQGEQSDDAI